MMSRAKNTGRCTSCTAAAIFCEMRISPPPPRPTCRIIFSTITTEPSTTMPKSSAPSESRLAGIFVTFKQNGGEQQRERNGCGHDQGAAHVPQEQEQHDHHQDQAFGQVVQDRVGGVVDQVPAVQVRHDLYARRQHCSFRSAIFSCSGPSTSSGCAPLRMSTTPSTDIVVIDYAAIHTVDRLADLAQPDFRPLLDLRHVAHTHRSAVLCLEQCGADVAVITSSTPRRAR